MAYNNMNSRNVIRQPHKNSCNSTSSNMMSGNSGCNNTPALTSQGCAIKTSHTNYDCHNHYNPSIDWNSDFSNMHLAIAYVPWQNYEELFPIEKAFMVGTVFPSLFKPFLAGGKC